MRGIRVNNQGRHVRALRAATAMVLATVAMIGTTSPSPAHAAMPPACAKNSSFSCLASFGYSGSLTNTWADRYYGAPETGNHNCTRFAGFMLARTGIPDPGSSFGHAWNWGLTDAEGGDRTRTSMKERGFAVSSTPAVGSIAWSRVGAGHVGLVLAVSGSQVLVASDNYISTATNSYADITWRPTSAFTGFILAGIRWNPSGDLPVTGDWNGDGRADPGVFNPTNGTWTTRFFQKRYGSAGDIPVPGDWNGDGRWDVGVFNPANGTWTTEFFQRRYGSAGDIPVAGDWNGDGRWDVGVFNPKNATWTTEFFQKRYGSVGDVPVVGDWNGDRRSDVGVFNTTNATWTTEHFQKQYGSVGDRPVPGDWNADRKAEPAVWNPVNALWTTAAGQQTYGTAW